ncbi:MAG: thioredoxin [Fusobacteriaceae bacterium]
MGNNILEINESNFDKEVIKSSGVVVVDFWAEWCGPCKMLGSVLEELANEMQDIKICKINVEEEPLLAGKYKVRSIPTVLIFRDGNQISNFVGFKSKDEILEKLANA